MIENTPKILNSNISAAVRLLLNPDYKELFAKIDEDYLYWDKVKYMAPEGVRPEILWQAVKIRRSANQVNLKFGRYLFRFTITGKMQNLLHEFDMNFGGNLGAGSIIPAKDSNWYLVSSIMEEAIASSQMEGASTTRKVAKEMLRKQSKPIDRSQQMIVNNYSTIQYLVNHKDSPFSVDALKYIHRSISSKTLDNPEDEGRFRTDNNIFVMDNLNGEVVHTPPETAELDDLLTGLCKFANDENREPFVHPIVKGIIIHFMLAYFHPFVDGNGRTARSLVYWYLLKQGYWLTEYLSISRVIYKSKARYEHAFLYTEYDDLDLSYFIDYNLETMRKAYEELKAYLQKKLREQEDLYEFRGLNGINERQAHIIRILREKPSSFFTVNELTLRFKVTPKTARSDLRHLVELGLMAETNINKRKIGYTRTAQFEELISELTEKKGNNGEF